MKKSCLTKPCSTYFGSILSLGVAESLTLSIYSSYDGVVTKISNSFQLTPLITLSYARDPNFF